MTHPIIAAIDAAPKPAPIEGDARLTLGALIARAEARLAAASVDTTPATNGERHAA